MLTVVNPEQPTPADPLAGAGPADSVIDEIVREGARRMLAAALEAEVAAYAGQLDKHGHRLVVRNGHAQPRQVLTAAGAVQVVAPRVNDKRVDEATGTRRRFTSAILSAWCRKSPKITEVLPLLYLHRLSSKDFGPVDEERLCLLVLIGVRADGLKELIALTDGYRESTGSWADLLRDCARRGMRAPVLAIGDGALGFWAALREVFPTTREQRCWFHKRAIKALAEIWNTEGREHARRAAAFKLAYGAKFGKAVAKITDDAGIAMAFKLIEAAQARWRAVNAPHLVALVRAGATFERGKLVERGQQAAQDEVAA